MALWAMNGIQCIMDFLHVLSVRKKLNLNTPKLGLDCLKKTSGKHVRAMNTPIKPHFYIVKVGYAGVYLFFLFLLQNIDYGYSLEPPR